MTHTPGPWTVAPTFGFDQGYTVRTANDRLVGYIACENQADVVMMTAAPDLLAALRAMVEPFALTSDEMLRQYPDAHQPRAILAARAAIAKATTP